MIDFSIVIPAKNEAQGLKVLLPGLKTMFPGIDIIVVNDGSCDSTANVVVDNGGKLISQPVSMGNGAAIKAGARAVKSEYICFMDADGQHTPESVSQVVEKLDSGGYDMVVGARSASGQAGLHRGLANYIYNKFATLMVGQEIRDLTSGLRVVNRKKFLEFLHLLPNKFSYPTTITMAFFRSGYTVGYLPIDVKDRIGKSHLKIWKDGVRFLLIIFKVGTLYSPLKLFLPISVLHFFLGLGYYAYTLAAFSRFTNMSALLFTSSIMIFLMGLLSEQITNLTYSSSRSKE